MSLLDQANNPRRLVVHDDASVVHACTYPCATLLGGIRWWIQRDRLSHPLHSLEGQAWPWGVCITPASGGEELHLYSSQVIKDLHGLDPSSLTGSPSFRGNGSQHPRVQLIPFDHLLQKLMRQGKQEERFFKPLSRSCQR